MLSAYADSKKWGKLVSATLAAAVITFGSDLSALADLNKYEAELRGEFGIGSAAQFGSADLRFVSFQILDCFLIGSCKTKFLNESLWFVFVIMQESSACERKFQVITQPALVLNSNKRPNKKRGLEMNCFLFLFFSYS